MVKEVATVRPDDTITEVVRLFLAKGITSAVVADEKGQIRGIITDGDILAAVRRRRPVVMDVFSFLWVAGDEGDFAAKTEMLKKRKVKELMTRQVVTVTEDADIPEIAQLMVENGIKQIPVVRGNQVVGLVRRHDVVKAVAQSMAPEGNGFGRRGEESS